MNQVPHNNQEMGDVGEHAVIPDGALAILPEEVSKNDEWIQISSSQFKCKMCSRTTKTKYNIRVHVKSHLGLEGRAFICPICESRFIRSQELANHMNGVNGCRGKNHKQLGRPVGSVSVKSEEIPKDTTTNEQNIPIENNNLAIENNNSASGSAAVWPKRLTLYRKSEAAIEEIPFVNVDVPSYESFCETKELVLYSTVDCFFNIKASKVTNMRNPLGPLTELHIRRVIMEVNDVVESARLIIQLPEIQTCMREKEMDEKNVFSLLQEMISFLKGNQDCVPFILPPNTFEGDGMGSGIGLGVKTTKNLPSGKTLFELSGDLCPIVDEDLGNLQKEQLFSTIKVQGKSATQFLLGPLQFVNNDCKNYNAKYSHLKKPQRVVLQTVKDINAGEELLVRYFMKDLKCKC